jgi:dephospho-CoA kinase
MFHGKPIIGIVGGIGSGKSYVADLFAQFGCHVIKADDLVHQAYAADELKATLRSWWGDQVLTPDGQIDRKAVAQRIFNDEPQRQRLEALVHPLVHAARDRIMTQLADNPAIVAFVWDTPLLFEVGMDRSCDAVVFVDCPLQTRLLRVRTSRGWDQAELQRRENAQLPLDKKRELSQYMICNTADSAFARRQVEVVISRILQKT